MNCVLSGLDREWPPSIASNQHWAPTSIVGTTMIITRRTFGARPDGWLIDLPLSADFPADAWEVE